MAIVEVTVTCETEAEKADLIEAIDVRPDIELTAEQGLEVTFSGEAEFPAQPLPMPEE